MARKQKMRRLSAGEMEMLQMLWRDDPVTLSEAQQGLRREIGYTTEQTWLNRLVAKDVVASRYFSALPSAVVTYWGRDLNSGIATMISGCREEEKPIGHAQQVRSQCSLGNAHRSVRAGSVRLGGPRENQVMTVKECATWG